MWSWQARFASFGASILAIATPIPAIAASLYSVTELPFLPRAINNVGQVVGGQSSLAVEDQETRVSEGIYLWDEGNVSRLKFQPSNVKQVGTDRFYFVQPTNLNDSGLIAGQLFHVEGLDLPFGPNGIFWDDDTPEVIKVPNQYCFRCGSQVAGFNDADSITLIAGEYDFRYGFFQGRALSKEVGGGFSVLEDLVNFPDEIESPIVLSFKANESGQAIGTYVDFFDRSFATLFFPGNNESIQLSQEAADVEASIAINDLGQVANGNLLWLDPANRPEDPINLGAFPGKSFSRVTGINNRTQVVGTSANSSTAHEASALLWEDNQIFDLNNLIPNESNWQLLEAFDINDQGQIIGRGRQRGESSDRYFLLTPTTVTPVAEPSAIAGLLVLGGLGLMSLRQVRFERRLDADDSR